MMNYHLCIQALQITFIKTVSFGYFVHALPTDLYKHRIMTLYFSSLSQFTYLLYYLSDRSQSRILLAHFVGIRIKIQESK